MIFKNKYYVIFDGTDGWGTKKYSYEIELRGKFKPQEVADEIKKNMAFDSVLILKWKKI